MAGLQVTRVENLGAGGGSYRLYFDGRGNPPIPATLFARFDDGAGLFMIDDPHRPLNPARKWARWFLVYADGRVVEQRNPCTFKLGKELGK